MVTINRSIDQLIHATVTFNGGKHKIWFTVVYRWHNVLDRRSLWEDLCSVGNGVQGPWLIMGDFNAIYEIGHRKGGNQVTEKEMDDLLIVFII